MNPPVVRRIENALWGAFIGDALAMPVHWFYSTERIFEQIPGGIDRYFPAPHPHPGAFMLGMTYQPDLEKADGDSVHRGPGLLLAAGSREVPEQWKTGLKDHHELAEEIHQFATLAAQGNGHLRL